MKWKVFKICGLAKIFLKLFPDMHNEEEPSKTSSLELRVIDSQTALVTHWIRSTPGFLMCYHYL